MKKIIMSILIIFFIIIGIIFGIYLSNQYILTKAEILSRYNSNDIQDNSKARTIMSLENMEKQEEPIAVVVELEKKEDIKVNFTAIGDIMCHNSQYNDAKKNGKYDFSYVFEDIKPYIENADIAVGNLETTFAGSRKGYSSYPQFNTPEILAQNLKDLGIDVLSTANNHSLDTGYQGIESTIDYLDQVGIEHTGTYKSAIDQNTIVYKEVNGLKIAFLAYTYGTNGIKIPAGKEYSINLIDKELIKKHLEFAKEGNPDVICVNMHWGVEYEKVQNEEQKELAQFLFENGADIVLGSHPHVLQPMEETTIILPNGEEENKFVIYSLGNFMSGQTKENTRNSIILNFDIIKNGETGKLTFENINYIPIYTYTSPNFKNYKVLDIRKALENYENGNQNITKSYYELLKKEYEYVDSIY